MNGAFGTLRSLVALGTDVVVAVAHVIVDHGQAFNEREASEFLANGGDTAPLISAAGVAAEPRSAPVEPSPPGAPDAVQRLYSDPVFLLRAAADVVLLSADTAIPSEVYDHHMQLRVALRDLAAQFEADTNPLTPESPDHV